MEIGTIGAGDFAQAFAKRVLKSGHKVKLSNSRGPESLREIVMRLGPGATAGTREEAVACEMVLLAVPWDNVPETLASLPEWKNQILIDSVNPYHGKAGAFTPAGYALGDARGAQDFGLTELNYHRTGRVGGEPAGDDNRSKLVVEAAVFSF